MSTRRTPFLPLALAGCAVALVFGCAPASRGGGGGGSDEPQGGGVGGQGGGGSRDLAGPCDAGAIRCSSGFVQTCNDAGAVWIEGENCNLSNRVCRDGGCVDRDQAGDAGDADGGADGGGQGVDAGQPDGGDGDAGQPGDDGPADGGDVGEGGEAGEGTEAADGEGGDDGDPSGICEARTYRCEGTLLEYCLSEEWGLVEDCADSGRTCEDRQCVGCEPGARACRGSRVVECDADGRIEETLEICQQGSQCVDGACVALCGAEGDDKASYQGCEYWAVDLDNADVDVPGGVSPANAQFAVVVSNVNADDVEVVAYESDDGQVEREVLRTVIGGGEVDVLDLPSRALVGSGKGFKAYRISASQAVIAYQFNPLNNTETAFSNDASLLIPSNALGDEYFAVTGDGINQPASLFNPEEMIWGAFVTIVGVGEAPVEVTVRASGAIQPPQGAGVQVNGRTVTATLARYEVLAVHSLPDPSNPLAPPREGNGNLSGTHVTANGPVAVFSGNVAIAVPVRPQLCCADHLEEQLWPVVSWGQKYVAARSLVRRPADPETDFWRITGSEDGTELTYRPRRPSGAPERLDEGDSVQFEAAENFIVEATAPIQVAQFLTSSQWVDVGGDRSAECRGPGQAGDEQCRDQLGYLSACVEVELFPGFTQGRCMAISDPALILVPPTEQYRDSYVFLAPNDYNTDFINVIAPEAALVELDGRAIDVNAWQDVGEIDGEAWRVANIVVADGRHTLESDADIGLLVYGYDQDVSYGYPGGLNLEQFDAPPPRE